MFLEISFLDKVIFLNKQCLFLRHIFPSDVVVSSLWTFLSVFYVIAQEVYKAYISYQVYLNKRIMDNALLFHKQLMYTIKIFYTKETISRNKLFIYKKINLNSDLVFIKTLKAHSSSQP